MEEKFLSVKDLHVHYLTSDANVYAVNGISFELERGKTLGLVGETGAGKTTIARAILGILPKPAGRVTSGEIEFEGKSIYKLPEKELQKIRGNKITMIFQDPMTALNPVMTVGEQIAEVVELHNGGDRDAAKKRAVEMLETVGIPAERYSEYPHQFSGGMQQLRTARKRNSNHHTLLHTAGKLMGIFIFSRRLQADGSKHFIDTLFSLFLI